jgi:hypothetical protein
MAVLVVLTILVIEATSQMVESGVGTGDEGAQVKWP